MSMLRPIGTYRSGSFDEGAAEIVAHDPLTQSLLVVNAEANSLDILRLDATGVPTFQSSLSLAAFGAGSNSVAISGDLAAVAVEAETVTDPGTVVLFRIGSGAGGETTLTEVASYEVGALPDMVTFTPDGSKLLVANEGEPDGGLDPRGSVSVIDLSDGADAGRIDTVDFRLLDFLGEEMLRELGVRVFPGETPSNDVEPEYIAVAPDGSRAFVTLQEANSVAVIDLTGSPALIDIQPLGAKDHSLPGNGLDANDDDEVIDVQPQPVQGLYMPDAIAAYEASDGKLYYVTANEGDSRDEVERVEDLAEDGLLDPALLPLAGEDALGRLEVSTIDGDSDGDGLIDQLFAYGGRSFSIWDEDGNQVFDSGDAFEQKIAELILDGTLPPEAFNANNDDNDSFDSRSDAKGPEPEGVTLGQVGSHTYAFVGLERVGGVMVYDVTDATAPRFVEYVTTRDFTGDPEADSAGDLGPEGLTFVSAEDSPTGRPMLVVSHEVSGSTTTFDITPEVEIHEIQGSDHRSAYEGQVVATTGIVTAVDSNKFFIQSAVGDGDEATSDGILVFVGGGNVTVAVGDEVRVTGEIVEFLPGGDSGNLTTTEFSFPEAVEVLSSGNPLPAATLLGDGGRTIPTEIDDDGLTEYQPAEDGIDFFESLEGMLVQVEDAVVVGPTNSFGEIAVLADGGAGSGERSGNGGVLLAAGDTNAERIIVDDDIVAGEPQVDVGDSFDGSITGVFDYSFGNFKLLNTAPLPSVTANPDLAPEVTALTAGENQLTVATYNVLNLDPGAGDRFAQLAQQIVQNLGSPDIIGLQEIQDNSGASDDGTVSADQTLQLLVDALAAAGAEGYEYVSIPPVDGADGGQPGANIQVAYLYNSARVSLAEGVAGGSIDDVAYDAEADALSLNPGRLQDDAFAEDGDGSPAQDAFEGTRKPLVAAFEFQGETVYVINSHLKSKSGDTPLYGAQQPIDEVTQEQRVAQAEAIQELVDSILADDPAAKIVALGDFNDFQFSAPLELLGESLANLTDALPAEDRYSYIFDGNSQSLDHILVNEQGFAEIEVDAVHVNADFAADGRASDHDPLVARLTFEEPEDEIFTLQLLHAADQEAGVPAVDDAPRFSAVMNALEQQDADADGEADYANTLRLSSGDAFIPGVFFSASEAVYGAAGRADILIQNELEWDAIALGNHEFDMGTGSLAGLLQADPEDGYAGALFPYLSSNLDFSSDPNLAPLEVEGGQAPQAGTVTSSVVLEVGGEQIGVVGATTPILDDISSPGGVGVNPPRLPDGSPDYDALAAIIQAEVDALQAANPGLNKVILLAHMQQIQIEVGELAPRLSGVDIIQAGGSNTLLADETDDLRDGDTAQGGYPIFVTGADGNPIAVVNTDGNYQYVGRLVIDFDENGVIIPESYDPEVSGAYATDAEGVAALDAEALVDPEIQEIADAIEEQIIELDSNYFGVTEVYLDGQRNSVRTEETNLGNLTADANLAYARQIDETVTVSIKNGGGIRDDIGRIETQPGQTEPSLLPPAGNELTGKPEGGISQIDIQNSLAFNNGLTMLTLTPEQLLQVLEHGVAESADGATPGRFPQIGGLAFSFDDDLPVGERVQSVALLDENGEPSQAIVRDGVVVEDAPEAIRIVTLNFLADGGDGYPFDDFIAADPEFADRVDLTEAEDAPRSGEATFAPDGSEQDALAEYLADTYPEDAPYTEAETAPAEDTRIQNLDAREDSVLEGLDEEVDDPVIADGGFGPDQLVGGSGDDLLDGRFGNDQLFGDDGDDLLVGGFGNDQMDGGAGDDLLDAGFGDDQLAGGAGNDDLQGSFGDDQIDGGAGDDLLDGDFGDDILVGGAGNDMVFGGFGDDILVGGAGDDFMAGGFGADVFVFEATGGVQTDTIHDFGFGNDSLDLTAFGFADFSSFLGQVSEDSGNLVIDLDGEGEELLVLNTTLLSQLDDSNVLI